jgi:hypothetical protein
VRREDEPPLDPRFTTPRVIGVVLAAVFVAGGLSLWLVIGDETPASELFWPFVGGIVLGVAVAWAVSRWTHRPPTGILIGICLAGVAIARLAPATVQVGVICFSLALFSAILVFVHIWPGSPDPDEG